MAAANDSCGDPLTARSSTLSLAYHDRDGLWRLLEGGFFRRMPLPRAEWTVPSSGKAFVLPPLTVLAQPISDPSFAFPPLPVNWYREPFVHVFLVRCESTDDYRRRVRPAVKAFADDMASRGAEWLVVYAPVGTREGMLGKVGQLMASALSEISGNKLQVKGGSTLSSRVYRSVHESLKADVGGRRHAHRVLRLDAWEGWRREEQAAARRRASAAAARAAATSGGSSGSSSEHADAGAHPHPPPHHEQQPHTAAAAGADDGGAPAAAASTGGRSSAASKLFGALKRQASGGGGPGGVFSRKSGGGDSGSSGSAPLTLKLNPAAGGSGPVLEIHRGAGKGGAHAAAPGSATFSSGGSASSSTSSSSSAPSFATGFAIREDGNVDEPLPPLEPADAEEIEAQWDGLIAAVRGCALDALTARVTAYDAEIAKRYDQRYVPGWNFCAYFAVAESLAFVYAQVRLPGQALAVYEAIENTFLLVSAPPSGPGLAAITAQLTHSGGSGSEGGVRASRRALDDTTGVRTSASLSSSGSGSSESSGDGSGSGPGRPGGAAAEPPARRRPSLQPPYAVGDSGSLISGASSGSGFDVYQQQPHHQQQHARASGSGGYNALYPLLQSLRTVAGIGDTAMLAPYPPALLAELTRVEAETGTGAVTAAAAPPSPPFASAARGGGGGQSQNPQHLPPAPVHPPSYSAAVDHTSDAWYIAAAAAGLAGGTVGGSGGGGTIGRSSGVAGGGGGGTIGRKMYGSMSGGDGAHRGSTSGLAGLFQRGHSTSGTAADAAAGHHRPPPQPPQSGSSAATAAAIAAYRQAAGRSGSVSGGDGSIGAGASWGRGGGGGMQRPALPPSLRPFPSTPPPVLPTLARPPPHVFDVSRKPYRSLLYGSHISLFDLRHYLFARQAALLLMGRRTQDLADRAAAFVRLAVDMATVSVAVGAVHPHTARAWIFAAAMDVVEVCTRRRPQAPAAAAPTQQAAAAEGAPQRRSLTASPPKPLLAPLAAPAAAEPGGATEHATVAAPSTIAASTDGPVFARATGTPPPASEATAASTASSAAHAVPAPPPPLTHHVATIGEGADEDDTPAAAAATGAAAAAGGAASVSTDGSVSSGHDDGDSIDEDDGIDDDDVSSISSSSSVAASDLAAALGTGGGSDDTTGSTGSTGPGGLGSPVPSAPGTPALHAAAAAAASGGGFAAFGGGGSGVAGEADLSLESAVDGVGLSALPGSSAGKRTRRHHRRSGGGGGRHAAVGGSNATAPLVPHLLSCSLSGDAMELNEQAPAAAAAGSGTGRSDGGDGGSHGGEAVPLRSGVRAASPHGRFGSNAVDVEDDADEAAGMAVPKERYDYRHASVSSRADGGASPPPPGADGSGRGTPTAASALGGVTSTGSIGRATACAVVALLRQRTGSSARASPTPVDGSVAPAHPPLLTASPAAASAALPAPLARGPSLPPSQPQLLLPASLAGGSSHGGSGASSSSSSSSGDGHAAPLPPHPPLSARSVRSDAGTPQPLTADTPQPSPLQAAVPPPAAASTGTASQLQQPPPALAPSPSPLAAGGPLTPHPPSQPHPQHASQQPAVAPTQASASSSAASAGAAAPAAAYTPQPPHPLALRLSYLVETARAQLVALVADVLGHDVTAPPSAGAADAPDELLALLRPRRMSFAAQLAAPRSPTASLRWSRGVAAGGTGGADAASSAGSGAPFAQAVSPFELAASVATAAAAAATAEAAEGGASAARDAHSASGLALAAALSARLPTPTAPSSSASSVSGSTSQQHGYHADRLFASLCYLGGYVAVRSGTPRRAATLDLQRAALLLRRGEPAAALSILAYHAPRLAREGWSGAYGWAAVLSAGAQWALGARHAGDFSRSALALCDPRVAQWVLPAWAATVARPSVMPPASAAAEAAPPARDLSAALLVRGGLPVPAAQETLRWLRRLLAAALRVSSAEADGADDDNDGSAASPSSASSAEDGDDDGGGSRHLLLPPGEVALLQRLLSRAVAVAAATQPAATQSLSLLSSPASAAPAVPAPYGTPLDAVLARLLWSPALLLATPTSSSSAVGEPPLPLAAIGPAPPQSSSLPGTQHSPLAALVGTLQWAAMAGYYVSRLTAAAQANAELREAARAAQAAAAAGAQRHHSHGGSPLGGSGVMYRRRTASRVVLPTAATLAHAASADLGGGGGGSSSPPPLLHYRELTLSGDGSGGPSQSNNHHHHHHRQRPSGSPPPPLQPQAGAAGSGATAATPYAKRHVTLPADTPAGGSGGAGGGSPAKEGAATHPSGSSHHFHYGQWQPMRPLLTSAVTLRGPPQPQQIAPAPHAPVDRSSGDAGSVPLAALHALLTPRPVLRGQALTVEVSLSCALPCGLAVAAVEVGLELVAAASSAGDASPVPPLSSSPSASPAANLHGVDPATLPVDPHAWVPLGPARGAPPGHLTTLPGIAQAVTASHCGWARPLGGSNTSDAAASSDAHSHTHHHPVVTFHSSADYASATWAHSGAPSAGDAPPPLATERAASAVIAAPSSLLVSTRTHAYRLRHTPVAGGDGERSGDGADVTASSSSPLRLRYGLTTVTLAATAPDAVATYRVASVRLVVVPGGLTLFDLAPLVGVGYSLRQLVEAARLAEAAADARTAADAVAAAAARAELVSKRTLADGTLHVDPVVSGAEAYPAVGRAAYHRNATAAVAAGAPPQPPALLSVGSAVRAALDQPASAWQRRADPPSSAALEAAGISAGSSTGAVAGGSSGSTGRAAGVVILDGYLSAHGAPAPSSMQAPAGSSSGGGGLVSVAEFAAGAHPTPAPPSSAASHLSPGSALLAQLAALPSWAREAAADVAAARRLPTTGAQAFHAHHPPEWTRLLSGLRVAPPDGDAEASLLRLFRRAADARAAAARGAAARQRDAAMLAAAAAAEVAARTGDSSGAGTPRFTSADAQAAEAAGAPEPSALASSPVQSLSLHSFLLGSGSDGAAAEPRDGDSNPSLQPPRLRVDPLLLPRSLLPLLLPAPHFPPGAGHGAGGSGGGHASATTPLLPLPPAPDAGGAPWAGVGVGAANRRSLAFLRLCADDDEAGKGTDVTDAGAAGAAASTAAAAAPRIPLASVPPHWFDALGAALGAGGGGIAVAPSQAAVPPGVVAVPVSERPPPVHVWFRAPHPAAAPIPLPPAASQTPASHAAPADVALPLLYSAPSVLTALVTPGAGAGPGGLTSGRLTLTLPPGTRSLGPALVAEVMPRAPAAAAGGEAAGGPAPLSSHWVSLADPSAPFFAAAPADGAAAAYRSVSVTTTPGSDGNGTLAVTVPLCGGSGDAAGGAGALPHGRYLLVHVPVAFRQPHAKPGAAGGKAAGAALAAPGAISRQASAAAGIGGVGGVSGRQSSFRSIGSAGSAGGGSSKQLVHGSTGGKLFPADARFEPSPFALLLAPAPAPPARKAQTPQAALSAPAQGGDAGVAHAHPSLPSILHPPFARVVALGVQIDVVTSASLAEVGGSTVPSTAAYTLHDPRVPLPLHHPFSVSSKVLARRPRGSAASAAAVAAPLDAAASRRTSISTTSDAASMAYAASVAAAAIGGGGGSPALAAGAAAAAAAALSLSRRVSDLLHSAHPTAVALAATTGAGSGLSLSPRSAGAVGRSVSSASAPAGATSLNDSFVSSPLSDGGGATDGAGALATASSDAASVAGTGTVIDDESDSAHVLLDGGVSGTGGGLAVRLRTFGGTGYHDAPLAVAAAGAAPPQRWPPAHPASPGGSADSPRLGHGATAPSAEDAAGVMDDDGSASGSGSSDDDDGSGSSSDDDGGDASGGSVYVQHTLRCYVPLPLALAAYALAPPLTSGWAVEVDGSRGLLGLVLLPALPLSALDGSALPAAFAAAAAPPTVLAFAHKFRRTISASNAIAAKLTLTFAAAPPGTRAPLLLPPLLDTAHVHALPPPPVGTLAAAVADATAAAAAAAYDGGDDALAAPSSSPAPLPAFTFTEEVALACAPSEALTETQLYGVMGMRR
jgi:hypothetical protein